MFSISIQIEYCLVKFDGETNGTNWICMESDGQIFTREYLEQFLVSNVITINVIAINVVAKSRINSQKLPISIDSGKFAPHYAFKKRLLNFNCCNTIRSSTEIFDPTSVRRPNVALWHCRLQVSPTERFKRLSLQGESSYSTLDLSRSQFVARVKSNSRPNLSYSECGALLVDGFRL
jgi:hypothetical protein